MKQSQKFYREARGVFYQSMILYGCVTLAGAWVAAAGLSDGALVVMAAAAVFAVAVERSLECARLFRLGHEEECGEFRQAIRPRL